jgi:hypothetical protein
MLPTTFFVFVSHIVTLLPRDAENRIGVQSNIKSTGIALTNEEDPVQEFALPRSVTTRTSLPEEIAVPFDVWAMQGTAPEVAITLTGLWSDCGLNTYMNISKTNQCNT